MRITWSNIDDFILTKQGNFKYKNIYGLILKDSCKLCGEPYFIKKNLKKGYYCSKKCSVESTKHIRNKGASHHMYGKHHTIETINKIRDKVTGKNHNRWKGGYSLKKIPRYDIWVGKLEPYGVKCRRSQGDENILEVQCHFSGCGEWFIPSMGCVYNKVRSIEGRHGNGEGNLYCSDDCKIKCPYFGKTPEQIEKEYMIKRGLIKENQSLNRSSQKDFRQIILKEYGTVCERCGQNGLSVDVHHIVPLAFCKIDILLWDKDNGMVVCKKCHHSEIHKNECSSKSLSNVNR